MLSPFHSSFAISSCAFSFSLAGFLHVVWLISLVFLSQATALSKRCTVQNTQICGSSCIVAFLTGQISVFSVESKIDHLKKKTAKHSKKSGRGLKTSAKGKLIITLFCWSFLCCSHPHELRERGRNEERTTRGRDLEERRK